MNYAEMKVINPALDTLEREVIARNEDAAGKEIWWSDVYTELKPALKSAVGSYSGFTEINTSRHWDTAVRHLESLATNMK